METVYRFLAALIASRVITQFIKQCRVIITKMTGNTWFPSPTPTLQQFTNDVNALDAAEQLTLKGPKGSAADRNTKLRVVRSDARLLKEYVQSIADANVASSQAIIEGSGYGVAKKPVRSKGQLTAKNGTVPGTVVLLAKALKKRVSYLWQMSTDSKTWTDLPATVKATTVVTGLTPATVYYFRFRTLTVTGLSDWSVTVSIIAH
jgi:hypothetical protein